jgi:hypothetical protein
LTKNGIVTTINAVGFGDRLMAPWSDSDSPEPRRERGQQRRPTLLEVSRRPSTD